MQIVPAILNSEPREVYEMLLKVRNAKRFDRVQVDFIDGEYANNLTVRPAEVDLLPFLPLLFDAHLMVSENNVMVWSRTAEKVGFDRIIVQAESISEPGNYNGLALDIHSPVEMLKPYLYHLEVVVVMAVEPGFGGQEFDSRAIAKVEELKKLKRYNNFRYRICVDGGVQEEYLPALSEAGADEVAVGAERVLGWN